jgi:hypothetical protein
MDDETREALEMTREERDARWNAGKPAKVRKSEDFVQRMKRVVDESTRDRETPAFEVYSTVESRSRHVTRRALRDAAESQAPGRQG